MLGAQLGPYLEKGEWQVGLSYRQFKAVKQYTGTQINRTVMNLNANIITKLQLLDVSATYAPTKQWNVSLGIPFILYGSSNRALPATVANSPRFVQSTEGLGDISVTGRYWLLDCDKALDGNVALGLGFKAPTGDAFARDRFPNGAGQDFRLRAVDPSIQPGDGGWGILFDLQAFKAVGSFTVYVNGTYLANPRGQNNTPSPRAFLSPTGVSAIPAEQFNTVPDQYLGRVGVTHPVPGVKGLSALLGARIEGVPEKDVFGETIGFRRPGYVISIEPGLIYVWERTTFSVSIPVATQVNRQSVNGVPGDSTFADFIILAGVTHRFGR